LARGSDRRLAEISDLHTFEFPDEGSTPCFPLIMTMRGSKTNRFGRLETMGALRNKDPFICPLGALGFYLLYRWDLTTEAFPDFSKRSHWYNIRLLLSTKPRQQKAAAVSDDDRNDGNNGGGDDGNGDIDDDVAATVDAADVAADASTNAFNTAYAAYATYAEADDDDYEDDLDIAAAATIDAAIVATSGEPTISYNTQRGWIAKVFALIGLSSTKKTHLFRAIGAKLAELKGVSEDQIQRAGRWTMSQMMGCYLTSLPHNFMRRMAGHPDQKGCFEISRAATKPPDELLTMIWPELDQWTDRFGPDKINDLAASGFCELLRQLREVILQDSVFLKETFPDHFIWSHAVFQHPAYTTFAQRVKGEVSLDDDQPSLSIRIIQAMPDLVDNLQSINNQTIHQSRAQETRDAELKEFMAQIKLAVQNQGEKLQHITSGGFAWQLRQIGERAAAIAIAAAAAEIPAALAAPTATATFASGLMATEISTATAAATVTTAAPVLIAPATVTPAAMALPTSIAPLLATTTTTTTTTTTDPSLQYPIDTPLPPRYRMRRDLTTVRQLYQEWTTGLCQALPIGELDRRYGNRWRAGRGDEIQFYSLRFEIMREIRRIADLDGVSEATAMERVQGTQDRERWSLDKLCKRLRLQVKQRKQGRRQ
jgi:hypothetical protein